MEEHESDALINMDERKHIPQKDKYGLCILYALVFGISILLPWNAFITANEFFQYKLGNNTRLKGIFFSVLSVCNNVPLIIAYFLNTFFVYKLNKNKRAYFSLFIIMIGFIILVASIPINTENYTFMFFTSVMTIAAVLSVCSSLAQALFYGIFAYFPPKYMEFFLIGQSIAGIMVTVINIAIIAFIKEQSTSAYIYFLSAVFAVFISIIFYYFLQKNKYYRSLLVVKRISTLDNSGSEEYETFREDKKSLVQTFLSYKRIFRKILYPVLTVYLTFFCTLAYFPGLTYNIKSTSSHEIWKNKYFSTVYCFLIFNIGDLFGRMFVKFFKWPKVNSPLLPLFAFIRFLFFFLFAICHTQGKQYLPEILHHDAFPISVMFFFAFTNGYFPAIAFSEAASLVDQDDAELCNTFLAFVLGLGLASGSFLSFVFN